MGATRMVVARVVSAAASIGHRIRTSLEKRRSFIRASHIMLQAGNLLHPGEPEYAENSLGGNGCCPVLSAQLVAIGFGKRYRPAGRINAGAVRAAADQYSRR